MINTPPPQQIHSQPNTKSLLSNVSHLITYDSILSYNFGSFLRRLAFAWPLLSCMFHIELILPFTYMKDKTMGSQRDVIYRLFLLTNSALVYQPKGQMGGGVWVSANKYSCAHEAQITLDI
jgi:hypothetical protein